MPLMSKSKNVLVAIAEAANGHPHSDGVVVIGDDATTDYDGTTKAAVYVHSGITSVGAITQAAALSQQMRLTAQDLRELNILKYYRLTRKWVCKTYGLKDADLEL